MRDKVKKKLFLTTFCSGKRKELEDLKKREDS
jgi:hypothetical protein